MEITAVEGPNGTIYRLYRANDRFLRELESLMPLLRGRDFEVVAWDAESDPDCVLTVRPLDAASDATFRRKAERYLLGGAVEP